MKIFRRIVTGLAALLVLAGSARGQPAPLAAGGGAVAGAALADCPTDLRTLNQISGWQVRWPRALRAQPVGTSGERAAALERWRRAPGLLDGDVERLRRGSVAGRTAPRSVVRRVLDQVEGILAPSPAEPVDFDRDAGSALLSPGARADDPAFRERWARLAIEELAPAIRRYRDFLAGSYLPAARAEPGLAAIPGGSMCYLDAVETWTTLRLTGGEIERRGRAYLAELTAELVERGAAESVDDVPAALERLRSGEFVDGFDTRDDVVRHARAAIDRAKAAYPEWFATPDEIPVEVVPMDRFMDASFPAGFYRPPAAEGAPAAYVVNTGRPTERRLMSEVIAFHETVPGHHTGLAVPRAHGNAPVAAFNSGYVEGWAIYAERLADEMGLYSTPRDRLGLVAKHLWAAGRLVVEPGLHLHGWSRDRAIDWLVSRTTLSRDEAALEVDRYIALPGQSLSYVLGYLELRGMRRDAEAALGADFDVRAFHDVVLRDGARPLDEVRRDVEGWVAGRRATNPEEEVRDEGDRRPPSATTIPPSGSERARPARELEDPTSGPS